MKHFFTETPFFGALERLEKKFQNQLISGSLFLKNKKNKSTNFVRGFFFCPVLTKCSGRAPEESETPLE